MNRADIEQMADDGRAPAGLLFADGFDDCIIGLHWQTFDHESCVVYDRDKMIRQLLGQGLTYGDAQSHFDFNIAGAYVGKHTPLFCTTT